MSYSEALRSISINADASVGIYTGPPNLAGSTDPNYGKMYCFVKVTGDRACGLVTDNDDLVVGVLQNKPQHVGNACEVAIRGVTLLQVGTGGLAAGDPVISDTAGKGIAGVVGTDVIRGVCLKAGAAGSVASVLLLGLG